LFTDADLWLSTGFVLACVITTCVKDQAVGMPKWAAGVLRIHASVPLVFQLTNLVFGSMSPLGPDAMDVLVVAVVVWGDLVCSVCGREEWGSAWAGMRGGLFLMNCWVGRGRDGVGGV
jgi:hypothetical protein